MKPPPIRVRLTAWYLFVILASLTLYSIVTYLGLRKAIEDTVDRQLEMRGKNIAQFLLKTELPQASGNPQLLPESSGLGSGDELYQIADATGSAIYQSAAMHDLNIPIDTAHERSRYRHHRDNGNFTTYYRKARDLRVSSTRRKVGSATYTIQVATFVSPLYQALDTFRVWALSGLPLVVCAAGLGGYWLAGRAMKPIKNLVLSTREINEQNLARRIAVPATQDELHELAETMNGMLERLEAAFGRVTRFTADASHELRTPIAVIRTTSEVILERERSGEQYRELVGRILKESESASALIEQLLTLARTDAETERLSFGRVDLRELVAELGSVGETHANKHGLEWFTDLPDDAVLVEGDRKHLRRLLLILIDNACQYTEEGGSIRLALSMERENAMLEVTDNGIGIPPAESTQIFERFFRASNTRFRNPDGSGLGLSIAQWIAHAHGGTLTVKSTLGAGTSVVVHLRRTLSSNG